MNYFLYASESSVTGKELLKWLQENGAPNLKGGTDLGTQHADVLIRWGSRKPVKKEQIGKVINSAKSLANAADKALALKLMLESGVPIPDMWSNPVNAQTPCLGRKDHHSHGKDIILCLQVADVKRSAVKGCTHWTKYVPVKIELRIHVYAGQIIKISEKVLEDESKYVPWMRNADGGHVFKSPITLTKTPMAAKLAAVEAVDCLGLDFGAVDLLISDDNKVFVLEVNAAPSLIENGVERYGKRFLEALAA